MAFEARHTGDSSFYRYVKDYLMFLFDIADRRAEALARRAGMTVKNPSVGKI